MFVWGVILKQRTVTVPGQIRSRLSYYRIKNVLQNAPGTEIIYVVLDIAETDVILNYKR